MRLLKFLVPILFVVAVDFFLAGIIVGSFFRLSF